MSKCKTCKTCETCKTCGEESLLQICPECYAVESRLDKYLKSQAGRDFVRKRMPTLNDWPRWDYEAVLSKHGITVEQTDEYWWSMDWKYGCNAFNVDDEVIARQVSALFAELFLRNFAASFADNVAHGYGMWLELQDQRYSFELTEDLGNAVLMLDSCHNTACLTDEEMAAWDKLVETAGVLKESDL